MSFGEGDLHERIDNLMETNGELCAEINRQERRIRELETLAKALYVCATDGDCDDCPLNDAEPVKGETLLCDGIGPRLEELGLEVR